MEKSINYTLKIIIIILFVALLIGIFYLLKSPGSKQAVNSIGSKNSNTEFNIKAYADQKGYKDYFTAQGNWYINDQGTWKTVADYAAGKGYKSSFLFRGVMFKNTNGNWVRVFSK